MVRAARPIGYGVVLAVLLAVVVVPLAASPPAAVAATTTETCSFATPGTGTYASTLCWFDLSAYDAAAAATAGGQTMSISLPGGYTITFALHVTGTKVTPTAFPTYGGAYLGNNGHYAGVAGKPALYETGPGTTTATLDHISVVDASGAPQTGYAFVGADAESTDAGESITWGSNTPLSLLSTVGNACTSGTLLTGVGTTTVKCSATKSTVKTGTAILAAQTPTTFSQTMVGAGREGVAFGVLVSTVQLTKTVASRIDPSDAFGISVTSSSGSVLASADTGTAASATTGPITVLTSNQGADYVVAEQVISGLASNYDSSWSCTRNGATDPDLPSGDAGPSATVSLGIGDFVDCTITNTAKPVGLSLVKQATPNDLDHDGLTDAGDTISYTFTVTNTGALTLSDIGVIDTLAGPVTCPVPTLDPGESETCTADHPYVVTATDEPATPTGAGSVDNTAVATGTPPGSTTPVTSPPSTTSTPTERPTPLVALTKMADASTGDDRPPGAGDTIAYSYLVTNTGNVPLASVAVTDPTAGPVACPTLAASPLPPGQAVTCHATTPYVVTPTDVAAGKVTDTATATGTSVTGTATPPATSTAVVQAETAAPQVAIDKSAAVTPPADQDGAARGDTIAYSYLVTNTGNVPLASVAVTDATAGPVACPTLAASPLPPGQAVTCTADTRYVVTQADVDAGQVVDTAFATGTSTTGVGSPRSGPSTVTVPTVAAAPAVSLVKTAAVTPPADQGGAVLGDTIAYSYLVTNTGNVSLASVAVGDPTVGSVACPTLAASPLVPGASVICTADAVHSVVQADVDAGQVVDTATATGTDTAGVTSDPSPPSTAAVPVVAHPAVSVVKAAAASPVADQDGAKVGDTIAYSYLVTNTGDVTLSSVAVTDPSLGTVRCPTPAPLGLGPGGTVTCTGDTAHTVTQADVDAGQVVDTATATGTSTTGVRSPPSDPSTATVPAAVAAPAVSLVKAATVTPPADQDGAKVGDTIAYSYAVTNIGNVSLSSVAVTDPTGGPVTCPTPAPPGLAPGGSVTCRAGTSHVVTTADLAAGKVVDTATATGTGVRGGESPPSAPSTATVPVVAGPSTTVATPPAAATVAPPGAATVAPPGAATVAPPGAATVAPPGAATVAPVTATTTAPGGLGSIDTDLGRWSPPAGGGRWWEAGGLAGGLVLLGLVLLGLVLLGLGLLGACVAGWRRRHVVAGHGGRRAFLVVASVLAVAAGAGGLAWAGLAGRGGDASRPAGSSTAPASPATGVTPRGGAASPVATAPPGADTDAGWSLVIPAIGVDAPVVPAGAVGSAGTASLAIPDDIHEVGWWDGTVADGGSDVQEPAPAPGQAGVAVLAGHVDSAAAGPGALYHLAALTTGDAVRLVGPRGTTSWTVLAPSRTTRKSALPPSLFATAGPPRLALVTCGGPFDAATGHYLDNVIVWAAPSPSPAGEPRR